MVRITRGKQGQFSFLGLRQVFLPDLFFLTSHMPNDTLPLSITEERIAKAKEALS
jgi:hypothetical protein